MQPRSICFIVRDLNLANKLLAKFKSQKFFQQYLGGITFK